MRPRRGFEILAALGIVGTAVELAVDRHWDTAIQLIPWAALVAIAVALGLVQRGPPVDVGQRRRRPFAPPRPRDPRPGGDLRAVRGPEPGRR